MYTDIDDGYCSGMRFGYPIVLDLTGVPVLVVGGGQIAARKASGLLEAGARLTVVAPVVGSDLAAAAAMVHERPYRSADIAGHQLVLTATDDPTVNAQVAIDARQAGVWVNSADDPENCSFILPALARRGSVVVAVGTDGSSPALARHLRDRIAAEVLTPNVEAAAQELARQRAALRATGVSTESIDWTDRVREALEDRAPQQPGELS
jgi:precorrin-2 dehydrogenase/sirohydrochlorin ferrochelatase